MNLKLSVLDTQSPAHLPDLLPEIERVGFLRYWSTEHHSGVQSASPTIIAGLAAGITERMRVGTAGVLLRAASPLRVAEDFATLELFFPDRIDLGIAGATVGGAYGKELARDVSLASNEKYEDRVRRLVDMVRNSTLPDGATPIGPPTETRAQLWLCGTSARAAKLAGSLGISFAYHHYLASLSQQVDVGASEAYRDAFVSVGGSMPRLAIAAYGHCAPNYDLAASEWKAFFRNDAPRPSFLGTPEQVGGQLDELASRYSADELAIDCFAPSFQRRLEALTDIASVVSEGCEQSRNAVDRSLVA